jgi:preprotein translocase subunit SecE
LDIQVVPLCIAELPDTGVAQLVEHWSPKPGVGSSSLSSRAKLFSTMSLKGYFQESYTELVHKVTWPTWSELQNSAVLVMVATLIIALVVAAIDFSFSKMMELIYGFLY